MVPKAYAHGTETVGVLQTRIAAMTTLMSHPMIVMAPVAGLEASTVALCSADVDVTMEPLDPPLDSHYN